MKMKEYVLDTHFHCLLLVFCFEQKQQLLQLQIVVAFEVESFAAAVDAAVDSAALAAVHLNHLQC